MSASLSPALKAILKSPKAKGFAVPAPAKINELFDAVSASAREKGVGEAAWLTLSTAALVTLNSPASLCALYSFSTRSYANKSQDERVKASIEKAAILREAGLKCISFSGIPRIINNLGALRAHLEPEVAAGLNTKAARTLNPENVSEVVGSRALGLWNSIYDPHSAKLLVRLAESHPDLPVHILSSHYGPLLADGSPLAASGGAKIGRVLTSMIGIACLRAQQGVAPQVTSHVFGLKKSLDVGSGHEGELPVEGQEFLTTDEGSIWLLSQIDRIVETVAGGSTFAPHSRESKL